MFLCHFVVNYVYFDFKFLNKKRKSEKENQNNYFVAFNSCRVKTHVYWLKKHIIFSFTVVLRKLFMCLHGFYVTFTIKIHRNMGRERESDEQFIWFWLQ